MTKKDLLMSVDCSTRGKRRKAVMLIIDIIERIRTSEEAYIERIPLNLQGSDAYGAAENSIIMIDEAIDVISSIYDY